MNPAESIWWHLAMTFHWGESSTGHSTRPQARDCFECQRIAHMVERYNGTPNREGRRRR